MTASPIRDSAGKLAITPGVKLSPCPFCGCEAEVSRMGSGRQSMIITCTDCGCTLESGETFLGPHCSWNSRKPDKPHAELVALVRELRVVLEDVRSLPVARSYPDGPCIESYLMDDVISALAKSEGV
jgi:hypothetical protein